MLIKSLKEFQMSLVYKCQKLTDVVCVNNMTSTKMNSFNSYVFVHEARHELYFKCEKPHFLH